MSHLSIIYHHLAHSWSMRKHDSILVYWIFVQKHSLWWSWATCFFGW